MNLSQAVNYLKYRHNDPSSLYWSDDQDIYPSISSRCSIIAAILGLIPKEDTSWTTTASTQEYAIPSGFIGIKAVLRDGVLLQEISEREWEEEKAEGTTPEGLPTKYHLWNSKIYLIPTPDDAYDLTIKGDQVHPFIDSSGDTIDIPEALHFAMLDGVLADMYTKYQNAQMATFYENKWNYHMEKTFPIYKLRTRIGSRFGVIQDSDTGPGTGHGLI